MTKAAPQPATPSAYYTDRCLNCHEPVDRDFLNDNQECHECAVRHFADFVEEHPHAQRAEIVAEGRRTGLADTQINLVMSIHRMNWAGQ